MNFFNIGTAELLLIFVIALIVVGPRRLPQIARDFGKILNDLRKMSQEFTAQMTQELDALPKESEIRELIAPLEEIAAKEPVVPPKAAPPKEKETAEVTAPSEEVETEEVATSQDVSEKEAHEDQS